MINEFKQLIKALRPVKTKYELIRVGGTNDGGYLLPNDLSGISTCFSPGVDVTATFEKDLFGRGIRSHLIDGSVDGPPDGLEVASFTKKYLGAVYNEDYTTLEGWMSSAHAFLGDYILQMDIEGAEYQTILACDPNALRRFRIIAVEVHDVQHWFNPIAWGVVQVFFAKLLDDFHIVHLHPNNNCPFLAIDNVLFPSVFELTLLRKDRADAEGFADELPHPLDQPNVLDKPDRHMPEGWYK